jgi:hypothetical protein
LKNATGRFPYWRTSKYEPETIPVGSSATMAVGEMLVTVSACPPSATVGVPFSSTPPLRWTPVIVICCGVVVILGITLCIDAWARRLDALTTTKHVNLQAKTASLRPFMNTPSWFIFAKVCFEALGIMGTGGTYHQARWNSKGKQGGITRNLNQQSDRL